jgi:hypothetical protein
MVPVLVLDVTEAEADKLLLMLDPRAAMALADQEQVMALLETVRTDNRAVVRFYNKRGTAEQWIKEGKQAVKMTRLSCHRFRSDEVRLWLSVIAYNLGTCGGGWCCRCGSAPGR